MSSNICSFVYQILTLTHPTDTGKIEFKMFIKDWRQIYTRARIQKRSTGELNYVG